MVVTPPRDESLRISEEQEKRQKLPPGPTGKIRLIPVFLPLAKPVVGLGTVRERLQVVKEELGEDGT